MSSIRRIISSRLNGALSKGPITKEGKRRSSQNAISHGLLAEIIVADVERPKGFFALLDQHLATFQPVNGVEAGLVEEMCAAQWRIQRTWCVENGLLNQALDTAPSKDDGVAKLVEAFRHLSTDDAFRLIAIYEGRHHRRYHRAIQTFLLLRQNQQPDLDPPASPGPETEPVTQPAASPTPDTSAPAGPENQMDKETHFTNSLFSSIPSWSLKATPPAEKPSANSAPATRHSGVSC